MIPECENWGAPSDIMLLVGSMTFKMLYLIGAVSVCVTHSFTVEIYLSHMSFALEVFTFTFSIYLFLSVLTLLTCIWSVNYLFLDYAWNHDDWFTHNPELLRWMKFHHEWNGKHFFCNHHLFVISPCLWLGNKALHFIVCYINQHPSLLIWESNVISLLMAESEKMFFLVFLKVADIFEFFCDYDWPIVRRILGNHLVSIFMFDQYGLKLLDVDIQLWIVQWFSQNLILG